MWDVLYYLLVVAVLAAALVAVAFAVRAYVAGVDPREAFGQLFAAKPAARIDVVEQASVDNRRRLLLIRRDDVEHLIMTGGPVDVVIETGITAPLPRPEVVESPVAYARAPRPKVGQ